MTEKKQNEITVEDMLHYANKGQLKNHPKKERTNSPISIFLSLLRVPFIVILFMGLAAVAFFYHGDGSLERSVSNLNHFYNLISNTIGWGNLLKSYAPTIITSLIITHLISLAFIRDFSSITNTLKYTSFFLIAELLLVFSLVSFEVYFFVFLLGIIIANFTILMRIYHLGLIKCILFTITFSGFERIIFQFVENPYDVFINEPQIMKFMETLLNVT